MAVINLQIIEFYYAMILVGERERDFVGGMVASWFPDRAVRVRALAGGHCVVFLGQTLYSHSASLHPGV